MNGERSESWEEQWYIWAAVAGLVTCAVLWIAFCASGDSGATGSTQGGQGGKVSIAADPRTMPGLDKLSALEKYIEWVRFNTPLTGEVTRRDLVDGSSMSTPTVDMKKSFTGGDATDMMSISMTLDERDPRRPVPGRQEWQLKTFTFPHSRATYMEIDLLPAGLSQAPGAQANMRRWDLAQLCPPLAALSHEDWTQDERQYVHYLTRCTMGMSGTETGFSALWAAYASNFALWHGQERSVPAAAYYALAAAHFEEHLAAGGPPAPRAAAVTWMICGECHRLLGRLDDARRCYAEAQKIADGLDAQAAAGERVDALHGPEKQVLELYHELAAARDVYLQRQPFSGVPEPPIGWYIEKLLPAINGDLDYERANWSGLRSSEEINAAITARIAAKRG